ncbi:DUF4175 domain-containing protein [Alphaproteobacteria bacterium KMM 3653]|uniref:DUF4175 domain-containing protein n=2 Tax=Harenicola maris TaxID=2841044 RepID=A0AAP2CXV1_9RHOB|nr:DUF4175 domain-containing protein [Harenicola maris]
MAERITRAFWPLWSVVFIAAAAVFLGLHETPYPALVWSVAAALAAALGWTLYRGIKQFRSPTTQEAMDRLDATLPGRPIQALGDKQAIGGTDAASAAVWNAHLARMAQSTANARAVQPDLRVSDSDPFALRYAAFAALIVALIFGSVWRAGTLDDFTRAASADLAAGPTWEGWIEPPAYTGKPSLYLNDIDPGEVTVAQGSTISLRLYGEVGALSLTESVSGNLAVPAEPNSDPAQSFEVTQAGSVTIHGEGGAEWSIMMEPDTTPMVTLSAPLERDAAGQMTQPFFAQDDFGITSGTAVIRLDAANVDRRYGLAAEPETREDILLDLPMTISGNRAEFNGDLIDNFSKHPWANLPVTLQLTVEDALGQTGQSTVAEVILPGRRFFDPLAKALIEQRRDILWSRSNAPHIAQLIRAITHRPEGFVRDTSTYLQVRTILRRLEAATNGGKSLTDEERDTLAEALWEVALKIEEGDLSSALERLRRAQDRLSEAIKNGASDDEIAQLMQEMQQAMQDYMRQLAQQQPQDGQPQGEQGETMELSQQDLQQMLDQLQEFMENGQTAEAQALLDQLMSMMENMQVTQNQNGQGQQSPGEQAMDELADTLREQQGLSDDAFRDLQEQFNPNANQGNSAQNQGRDGADGQGQSHQQGQGEGQERGENQSQNGQQQGGQQPQQGQNGQEQGGQQGQNQGQQQGQGQQGDTGEPNSRQSLAERQRALRNELNRQLGQLPGAGTEQGDAARRNLGEAGEAMDRAEDSLRAEDFGEALDNQAQAMEALREGMRNLGEALAENQGQQQPGQGQQTGNANPNARRDPLGRDRSATGPLGSDEDLLQGEDVYRRARDLLDEIRRRSSEQDRPDVELDYLKRLLERF